jgi:hypothetical protein
MSVDESLLARGDDVPPACNPDEGNYVYCIIESEETRKRVSRHARSGAGSRRMEIKAAANRDRLLQSVKSTSAEVGRLDADLAAATPGRAYLLRKQRERLVQGELNRLLGVALTGSRR